MDVKASCATFRLSLNPLRSLPASSRRHYVGYLGAEGAARRVRQEAFSPENEGFANKVAKRELNFVKNTCLYEAFSLFLLRKTFLKETT